MPYADPARRREYQKDWIAKRRSAWFEGKTCEICGSAYGLELDHRDAASKVDHRIWSWSAARRETELAKCRPLCHECHAAKSIPEKARGERVATAKLTEAEVRQIRASVAAHRQLARDYGVDEKAIREIRRFATWRHVA